MTFRKTLPVLGAMALLAGIAHAQKATPGKPNASAVQSGSYHVEPKHTRIVFSLDHMGFSTWYGDFGDASGSLVLDTAHPAQDKLDVTAPISSVSTTNAKLDGELKSPEFFDANRFPTAKFTSTSVTVTGPDSADVAGQFTLHGVTRPLTLHVKFHGVGTNPLDKAYTVGFDATGTIKRSEFGVAKYVPVVGDEVQLTISGAFEKGAA